MKRFPTFADISSLSRGLQGTRVKILIDIFYLRALIIPHCHGLKENLNSFIKVTVNITLLSTGNHSDLNRERKYSFKLHLGTINP